MLTYWIMYLIPASMALFTERSRKPAPLPWIIVGLLFIFLIGFRHEIGGDWFSYLQHYEKTIGASLAEALSNGDVGHQFLNWLMAKWDVGVYGVNFIYAIIFMIGLIRFSRSQTYPWIAVAVAVPYLVIMVVMGYSRQGVAIGLFLWAMSYLQEGKFKTYVVLILIAALFHKTAVLLLPLGIFLYGKGIFLRVLMIVPIAYGAWDLLLVEQKDDLWKNYVDAQMQSDGAKIRVVMNLFPSLLFLMYRKKWKRNFNDYYFWLWIAIGSIISVGLVDFASTAVDRIALYFIPIQMVVFARLPYLAKNQISPSVTTGLIIFLYAVVLFIWLQYANHSQYWIPYQNFLFLDIL